MKPTTAWLAAATLVLALPALGQAPAPEPAAPKKAEAKKVEPKKKPAAKKPAAKTPEVKKVAPGVTVYKDTPPPTLRGKDGAPIPTTPDAYDVSSALPAKKK